MDMTTSSEIAVGIAVTMIPFVAIGGLLWLSGHMRRREVVRVSRQIAVTDAIYGELGAVAAPVVRQGWLGGWTVSMVVPFEEKRTVGAVVRIAHDFFAKRYPTDASRLRIVLGPAERKPVRQAGPSSVPGPAAGDLTRAA